MSVLWIDPSKYVKPRDFSLSLSLNPRQQFDLLLFGKGGAVKLPDPQNQVATHFGIGTLNYVAWIKAAQNL